MQTTTSVLIIGGGPAGLAAASELAWHGVDTVLVEPRREVILDRPRAKTTSVRTMEHFRRWGVAQAIRNAAPLQPSWSDRVIFCDTLDGQPVTEFNECFGLFASRQDQFAESGQQIPQPILERVLRSHLETCDSLRTVYGSSVIAIVEHADHVEATVRADSGTTQTIVADYILGCDGANGVTRSTLAIDFVGESDPRTNFNVVFRAPELATRLGNAVQYWVVGGQTAGVIGRLDLDGTWWAIAPGIDATRGHAETTKILTDLVGHEFDHEVLATDPWTARMLIARRFQSARIFLVGEAAHLNPPWGGHGYNTCVGDAVNIGWKLAAVLNGWAHPDLLETYESERRPIVEDTVRSAVSNMKTLSTDLAEGNTHSRDSLAAAIQSTKNSEFHSLGIVLGYSYAGSAVIESSEPTELNPTVYIPSTSPGSRLPHTWLSDGRSLFDALGKGLTLIGPLAHDVAGVDRLRSQASRLGIPLTVVEAPEDFAGESDFILVRPDQHIACRSARVGDIDLLLPTGYRVSAEAVSA